MAKKVNWFQSIAVSSIDGSLAMLNCSTQILSNNIKLVLQK